jgi:hypothetical protein
MYLSGCFGPTASLFLFGDNDMSKKRYAEMLKDDRWQETRGRINNYAQGRCENCGSKTDNPHVHHKEYTGYHPSDTPDDLLASICPLCHYEEHWITRIRAYSAEKKRIYDSGGWIDEKLHQELTKRFNV